MKIPEEHIPARALIIDDQLTVRSIYTKVLKDIGVENVEVASTGIAGIRNYMTERPDVVLLDIKMPGMDGLSVIEEIRKIDPDANVIMLTSVSEKSAVIESLRKGAKNYLLKSDEVGDCKKRLVAIFRKLDLHRRTFLNSLKKTA